MSNILYLKGKKREIEFEFDLCKCEAVAGQ